MEYLTAFSIGLLGSLHCVGMCGPIALALPLNRSNSYNVFIGSILYNLGRVFTYFLIGSLFGLVGSGIALAGFQQTLSILVGVFMIGSGIWSLFQIKKWSFPVHSLWISQVKMAMAKRFGRTSNANLFLIGILNGLLPCGLVYMGLAGSLAMANYFQGGAFMAFFGLGTLPIMLSVAVYGSKIKKSLLPPVKRFVPIFLFLIGTLFILRGMNLGIPYLSPQLVDTTVITCH